MLAPRFVFCLPTTVEAVRLASLYIQSYSSVTLFLIQLRTDYCLGEGGGGVGLKNWRLALRVG